MKFRKSNSKNGSKVVFPLTNSLQFEIYIKKKI